MSVKTNAGFSLVDILVGMVIALLGVIIIFQVFSVSEGIKRTTTSGGDAVQSGAFSLFTLERSLKMAGYGLFYSTNLPNVPPDPAANAIPVTITPGAGNNSDTIILRYRQNWEYGPFPPDTNSPSFATIVIPPVTVETITVNPLNAQLVSDLNGVIAEGIVLLKAEYGVDVNGDGVIQPNEWNQAAPAIVLSVLAVRLAVVARSAQPEKPGVVGGACGTTTLASAGYPTWIDNANVPLNITAGVGLVGDDWKCYRYKTFESTVPLRNVMWRP